MGVLSGGFLSGGICPGVFPGCFCPRTHQFPQIRKNPYLAIQSISREVYNSVSRDGETIIINNVAMEIKTIKTRHIYKHLIGRKVKEPSSKFYFNRNFDLEEYLPRDKVYALPYTTTIESTTRVFQYKILNNILYLKKNFIG